MTKIQYDYESLIGNTYSHPVYGDYVLLDVIPAKKEKLLKIKFINTGYECVIHAHHFRANVVKDPYVRTIFNIACFGEPGLHGYDGHKGNNDYRVYAIWHAMISRCYNLSDKDYIRYGGIVIRVCDKWLNFANFYYDFTHMANYDKWLRGEKYELDKDALQQNVDKKNMIYSPETTSLISKYENIDLMSLNRNRATGYVGVVLDSYTPNYIVNMLVNNQQYIRATFNDLYYAAIYRDCYAINTGRAPLNDVPLGYDNFIEAQQHRVYKGHAYPYKKMYSLLKK